MAEVLSGSEAANGALTSGIRSVSYGGGVQSTALLVLAAQRRIDYPLFLMANVGDDSEHPASLDYVRRVAMPYAEANGIDLRLLNRVKGDGTVETLMGRLLNPIRCRVCKGEGTVEEQTELGPIQAICTRCGGEGKTESRSLPIPIRMSNGAPGQRSCTADFKIQVIGKWLKQHGATAENPATVAIGISQDEIMRANARRVSPWERVVYPLVSIGDDTGLRMTRSDCQQLIASAGLEVPPKSSCYFCPFHRPSTWQDMCRDEPDLFEKSAALEDTLNRRRTMLGKDPVFLTRFAIPLREAIQGDAQGVLFTEESDIDGECDSGVCFT